MRLVAGLLVLVLAGCTGGEAAPPKADTLAEGRRVARRARS